MVSPLQVFLEKNKLEEIYPSLKDNHIKELADLVYFLTNEDDVLLKLPSVVAAKLKRELEMRIEYAKGGWMKPQQEDFFNQYASIAALQRTPWLQIRQSFNNQFEYDEQNIIKKIWCSNSPLRQSLIDAYLPVELANALEKEEIRAIGDIPPTDFEKFSQGLTPSERKNLYIIKIIKIYQKKNSSSLQLHKKTEAEMKALREKIEKTNVIIQQVKESNDPSERQGKMTEIANVY